MKYLVPSAVGGGILGILMTKFFGRDYAVVAAAIAGALSYILIVYSLLPLVNAKKPPVLAPGLLGIAAFSALLFTYAPINIALGRPDWFREGIPFYMYIGAYGGLIGSIGTHLIQIGQTQGRTVGYIFSLIVFVLAGIGTALAMWVFGE